MRPRWLYGFARDGFSMDLAMSHGPRHRRRTDDLDEAVINWVLSPVTWEDFGWLREAFGGPVLAKGVLSAADARRERSTRARRA